MDHHKSLVPQSLILISLSLLQPVAFAVDRLQWAPEIAISFPQPLSLGAEFSCQGSEIFCQSHLKYFASGGYFQYPFFSSGQGQGGNVGSVEIGARYYPFSFPLRFSLGLGYRHVGVNASLNNFTIEGEQVATSASLHFSTLYIAPGIGYTVALSRKLFLGFEVGGQVSLLGFGSLFLQNSTTGQNSNNSSVLSTNSWVLNRVADLFLPTVTLFRLTWYFDGVQDGVFFQKQLQAHTEP